MIIIRTLQVEVTVVDCFVNTIVTRRQVEGSARVIQGTGSTRLITGLALVSVSVNRIWKMLNEENAMCA